MLKLTETGEIRLEVVGKNGKPKIYTQPKVPMKKSIEYAEGEMNLFQTAIEKELNITEIEIRKFRINFVAGLFNEDEITGDYLMNELDTDEIDVVNDIINFRVMGNPKETKTEETDSKN